MLKEFKKYKITYGIIGINVIVYFLVALASGNFIDFNTRFLVDVGALFSPIVVLHDEWWRLFTAMFLHGGLTHIGMNMFSLYLIGRGAELYFDTKSYLALYLFSGLLGGMASLYMHPMGVGVGASGAIFGIFGALAGFFIANRDKIQTHTKAFMKDFAVIIGINLVLGFSIDSIDVSAHMGGLLVGIVGGYTLSKSRKLFIPFCITMIVLMLAIANFLPSQYANQVF